MANNHPNPSMFARLSISGLAPGGLRYYHASSKTISVKPKFILSLTAFGIIMRMRVLGEITGLK